MPSITTNYAKNKTIDAKFRGQPSPFPATWYVGLITTIAGKSTAGSTGSSVSDANKNYAVNALVGLSIRFITGPNAGVSRSISGNTATTITPAIAFGSVPVLGDIYVIDDASNITAREVSGGGYARVAVVSNLANWSGTQGAGTTTVSSGTSGEISNNADIVFPQQTADWNDIGLVGLYDAFTGGNLWYYNDLPKPKSVASDDNPLVGMTIMTVLV